MEDRELRTQLWLSAVTDYLHQPDFRLWIPGTPVPRPSGKPYKMTRARRIMATPKAQKQEDAKISRGERWANLLKYRSTVQSLVRQEWGRSPIDCQCLTLMEFVFKSPTKRTPQDKARHLKGSRPDIKNLIFALEDALNPNAIKDSKGNVLAGFQGLWLDDSLSHTIGWRRYSNASDDGMDEGVHLKLWKL